MGGTISIATSGVVEGGIPIIGGVARAAVCSKLTLVDGWLSVTGYTSSRKPFIYTARMTLGAGCVGMRAGQLKGSQVVIETGRQPAAGGMARSTVCAILAAVLVVSFMAGIAVAWGSLINVVGMTT
jgi:hypothetical protein